MLRPRSQGDVVVNHREQGRQEGGDREEQHSSALIQAQFRKSGVAPSGNALISSRNLARPSAVLRYRAMRLAPTSTAMTSRTAALRSCHRGS